MTKETDEDRARGMKAALYIARRPKYYGLSEGAWTAITVKGIVYEATLSGGVVEVRKAGSDVAADEG